MPSTWVHTLGLHLEGLPELVIVEIKYAAARALISEAATRLLEGEPLGEIGVDLDLRLMPVLATHLRGRLFWGWTNHFGDDPSTVEWRQLILGDSHFCECCAGKSVPLDMPGPLRVVRRGGPNRAAPCTAARRRDHLRDD